MARAPNAQIRRIPSRIPSFQFRSGHSSTSPFLAERRELLTLAARRTHMRLEFLTSSHSRVRLVR